MANRTELVEIKKGQVGTGLLIENDGYISLNSTIHNKQLKEDFDRDSESWHVPHPFIVDAVFQKAGIKNANGRIYPTSILHREIERYQELIREKRALGECYKPEAMVLTEKGWVELKDVKEGERILTLNTETQEIEIQSVTYKSEYDYDGEMINVYSRHMNDIVTPNHGFPIFGRNGKFKGFYTAEDIESKNIPDFNHSVLKKTGEWIGQDDKYFVIPRLSEDRLLPNISKAQKEKYTQDLIIPMDIFAKFMGIYLSEGWIHQQGTVGIVQKKPEVCNLIEELLNEWGIKYTIEEGDAKSYIISDIRLRDYLAQFGECYDKFVPFELKQQKKETLRLFYDWFVLGDGRKKNNNSDDVFSTSKRLALDLNEIQLKIGYSGNYHVEARDNDRFIEERLIEGKNCHPLHFSLRSTAKAICLDQRYLKTKRVPYKGKVMCVEVPNHTWYVMDGGKCHWTKNCNHPSETTIDLSRISHNIIELHWEGSTVVGKLEINTTEGFRRSGICSSQGDVVANLLLNGYKIGVSSRAVGSVTTDSMGNTIVGEDLELICWDVVSSPSTPGAWIGKQEELQQYVESKEVDKTKEQLTEKINKLKNILK